MSRNYQPQHKFAGSSNNCATCGLGRERHSEPFGWFIVDDFFVLGYDSGGNLKLFPKKSKGVPSGAWMFNSEAEAQNELDGMNAVGDYPLFALKAKPTKIKL